MSVQVSAFINESFVERLMREHAPEKEIKVLQILPQPIDNSASILSVLTAGRSDRPLGHFGLMVIYEEQGLICTRNMVMKIKPHGREIVEMLNALAAGCGEALAGVYAQYKSLTGFQHSHMREIEVYGKLPDPLQPQIFGLYVDEEQEIYIILMEYLQEVGLLNTAMAPEKWTNEHIKQALKQMAAWHARFLDQPLPLNAAYWDDVPSKTYMLALRPLWQALLDNATARFPDLYTPQRQALLQEAIGSIATYWTALEQLPKTLVHNDLNPRNTCFKREGAEDRLCLYDWELATLHVPQYDVAEFLSFVLDKDRYALRSFYLEFYRQQLHQLTGKFADNMAFKRGFALAALDFGLHRLGMYMMAHSVSPYPFLPRVVNSYFNTLEQQMAVVEGLVGWDEGVKKQN